MPHFQDEQQAKLFSDMHEKEAEILAQMLAERYEIPYIDLARVIINNNAIRLLPEESSRKIRAVVFAINKHDVSVAVQSPNDPQIATVLTDLERQGYKPTMYIASEFGITRAFAVYKEVSYAVAETAGVMSISDDTIQRYVSIIKTVRDVKAVIDGAIASDNVHALSAVVEIIMGATTAVTNPSPSCRTC